MYGNLGPRFERGSRKSIGIPKLTTSTTAPIRPNVNDLWWKSDEGKLKVFYNDGSSCQWVDASPQLIGPTGATGPTGPTGVGATGVTGASGPAPTQTTVTATTSGTTISLSTTIPASVTCIDIMFNGVSASTAAGGGIDIQIGPSGGIVTTGYVASGALNATGIGWTTGFPIGSKVLPTAGVYYGIMHLRKMDGANNIWVANFSGSNTNSNAVLTGSGAITLAGVLTQVAVNCTAGAFSAGSVSMLYW